MLARRRIVRIDELRQEGHEEQHHLGVEQVDADAGEIALPQRRLLAGSRDAEAAAVEDRLLGEPEQIDRAGDLEREEGRGAATISTEMPTAASVVWTMSRSSRPARWRCRARSRG